MSDIITENWKVFPGLLLGAFVVGLIAMVFIRDGMRKWLLNGDVTQQIVSKECLTAEEHMRVCEEKWDVHEKQSQERWVHNNEIAAKNRELVLVEIDHLKQGQDDVKATLNRILNKVNGGHL